MFWSFKWLFFSLFTFNSSVDLKLRSLDLFFHAGLLSLLSVPLAFQVDLFPNSELLVNLDPQVKDQTLPFFKIRDCDGWKEFTKWLQLSFIKIIKLTSCGHINIFLVTSPRKSPHIVGLDRVYRWCFKKNNNNSQKKNPTTTHTHTKIQFIQPLICWPPHKNHVWKFEKQMGRIIPQWGWANSPWKRM